MPGSRVLFVCIGNAGRSQMAQAFYERAGGEACSAGTQPSPAVHPEVVAVMRERGIDLEDRVPHKLSQKDVEWAELVVTMGCGDACPVLPGKQYLDWNLLDPAGMPVEVVREIRDRIAQLVDELPG
ncbi:MAG: arsenate reductase ArsC [Actinomycetota bacterium]